MVGATLAELRDEGLLRPPAEGGHVAVKEAVLPFNRFPDVDTVLGPEMRSTGEVMGIDRSFGLAFAQEPGRARATRCRSRARCSSRSPTATRPRGSSRRAASPSSASRSWRPPGTADGARGRGHPGRDRRGQGRRGRTGVDAVELISSGKVDLVVNTPRGRGPRADGVHIRRAAIAHGVAVRHHRRGRPRRRGRDRRGGRAASPTCARCRSTTATASSGSRSDAHRLRRPAVRGARSTRRSRSVRARLPNPIVAASGTFGHGDEVARAVRPARASARSRRSRVAAYAWAGNPRAARHRDRRAGCQRGRAARARVSTRGSRTTCPRSSAPARASSRRSGATPSTTSRPRPRSLDGCRRPTSSRSRSTCRARTSKRVSDVFAHSADATHAAIVRRGRHGAASLPVFAKLSPNVTDLVAIARRRGRRAARPGSRS